jgi:PAS domain S-box-containing protein
VAVVDRSFRIRSANAALSAHLGTPAEQLIGQPVERLKLDAARYGEWLLRAEQCFQSDQPTEYTFHCPAPDSAAVRFRFTPLPTADALVVVVEPPAAHAPVADLFGRLMSHVPFAAWLRDEHSRYLFVNAGYRQAAGPDREWEGELLAEMWPAELAEQFTAGDRKLFASGQPVETLDTAPTADGQLRTWHNVKFPLAEADGRRYAAGIAVDVTDRVKLEEDRRGLERQLLQDQKLESLGVLAGGVAHDFNNLLTTILGNAGLARATVSDPSPVSECMKRVEAAAMRAAELCQQMLAYSGRGQFVVKEVSLNAVAKDMAAVSGAVLSKRAVVEYRLADPPPVVRADATQLRQVLLNLLTNASDSLGGADGRISVSTGRVQVDAGFLARHPQAAHLEPGEFAFVQVVDTGAGMDDGTRARMFEPFFTTKFTGRGLGLSAVQGIVRGHGGVIEVASQVGQGSRFTVYLPAARPKPADAPLPGNPSRPGRGRTVLVVDDEEDVRSVTRRLLESAGFRVLLATDGQDGVTTFRSFHEQVAVVLLDQTMPRMSGPDAFHEMRRVDPAARVILTSGYGRETLSAFDSAGLLGFLRKPFTREELLDAVFAAAGN